MRKLIVLFLVTMSQAIHAHATGCDEILTLPAVKEFDQCDTQLCWASAALTILETRYNLRFPGQKIELSRRALLYSTMRDRYLRAINGEKFFSSEAGTILDAIQLIKADGLVAMGDYPDVRDKYGNYDLKSVLLESTKEKRLASLRKALDTIFSPLPLATEFQGTALTRKDFAARILEDSEWESYAASDSNLKGYYAHADSDARPETRSLYVERSLLREIIKKSLRAGWPVGFLMNGHIAVIYGATYGTDGSATEYKINDSYIGPYHLFDELFTDSKPKGHFYSLPADRFHEVVTEITTLKLDAGK